MKVIHCNLLNTKECKRNLTSELKISYFIGVTDINLHIDSNVINFKMIDLNDDYVVKSFSNDDCYEPGMLYKWIEFSKKSKYSILDIGASTGLYSLIAASVNRSVYVHAFEPYSRAYSRLINNKYINFLNKIKIHCCALSDNDDVSKFSIKNLEGPITTAGSLDNNNNYEFNIPVIKRKLSSELADNEKIGLIKIDAEGHELHILENIKYVVMRDTPIIFCEILNNDMFEKIFNFLERIKYELSGIEENSRKVIKTNKYVKEMRNYIAIPRC